jgi:hypothetical protein
MTFSANRPKEQPAMTPTLPYLPLAAVWLAAVAAALVLPDYALRCRVPWPVCAVLILALMVLATVVTGVVVRGVAG